jgi:hypothetical protein
MNLPTPWYALPGHVCPFAVRVERTLLSGFSREHDYPHYPRAPQGLGYYQVRLGLRA